MSRKASSFNRQLIAGKDSPPRIISLFDSQPPAGASMPEQSGGSVSSHSLLSSPGMVASGKRLRLRLLYPVLAVALLALLGLGVMGKNGWLPHTDSLSGKRTGWFGKPLPADASSGSNPMASALVTATPQLAKEYIYAGSRMLAVEDAGASAAPPADLAVWRPTNGTWYVLNSSSQQTVEQWGTQGDEPVQGDYDGDGKTEAALFRPAGGNGYWYYYRSTNGALVNLQFGLATDTPVPTDYDGDGKADIALWREGDRTFYILRSSDGALQQSQLGLSANDKPVPADYDGDGRADYAVRSGNDWIIRQSANNQTQTIAWQQSTDIAVPNDYDGDGRVDIAVWRNGNGNWYIRQSSKVGQSNELRQVYWGAPNDIPVPSFYRR